MEPSPFLVQLTLSLAMIVVLIVALGLAGKYLVNHRHGSTGNLVKVLSCTPVGTRERLILISIGTHHVLLGITATSINPLLEVSADDITNTESEQNQTESSWVQRVLTHRHGTAS